MDWHIHLFIHPSSCPLLNIYHEPDPVLCAGDLATKNTDLSPACGLEGGGGRKNIKQLHQQLYHYDGDIPQEGLLTPRHMCSTLSIVAKEVVQELTGNSIRIRKEIPSATLAQIPSPLSLLSHSLERQTSHPLAWGHLSPFALLDLHFPPPGFFPTLTFTHRIPKFSLKVGE